ncbi:unnamed protein product [Vicia faba]|uniref:Uncharacterized protein n=1 Tax=Vicia faba TaxID=3906 RepID=A0AAV0YIC1_VICFA|nr:unnamed protein product [Vicia faba]
MSFFNLNLSLTIVAVLLLLSTAMAQSPTKSQPPRKSISPSPAAVTQSPASSPASGSSPPQPFASTPAISPSSIPGPPSEAPGPASNAVVLNRVSVAAGSALMIFVSVLFLTRQGKSPNYTKGMPNHFHYQWITMRMNDDIRHNSLDVILELFFGTLALARFWEMII